MQFWSPYNRIADFSVWGPCSAVLQPDSHLHMRARPFSRWLTCLFWHFVRNWTHFDLIWYNNGNGSDNDYDNDNYDGDGNGDCDGDGDDWQAKPKWSKVGDSPIRTPCELWSATALCTDYGQTAFCWLLWVVLLQDWGCSMFLLQLLLQCLHLMCVVSEINSKTAFRSSPFAICQFRHK